MASVGCLISTCQFGHFVRRISFHCAGNEIWLWYIPPRLLPTSNQYQTRLYLPTRYNETYRLGTRMEGGFQSFIARPLSHPRSPFRRDPNKKPSKNWDSSRQPGIILHEYSKRLIVDVKTQVVFLDLIKAITRLSFMKIPNEMLI